MGQRQSVLQQQLGEKILKKSEEITEEVIRQLSTSCDKGHSSIQFEFPQSEGTPRLSQDVIFHVQSLLSEKGIYSGIAEDEYNDNEVFSGCGGWDVVTEYRYKRTIMPVFMKPPSLLTRFVFWAMGSKTGRKPLTYLIHS